jgi:TetR/AcrR family transcriptional repressor of nem operon
MARPKEFDPDVALDAAIEVFRHKGYEATSVQDLVEAMEIHRASLYDTFGDKHDLYLAALDRYDRTKIAEYTAILAAPGSKIAAIRRQFENIVDSAIASGGITFGCLTTNSTMERAALDPKIAERAVRNFQQMEGLYLSTLQQARELGEIAGSDRELRAIARFLVSTAKGLRVSAKADCSRETFNDILCVAFSVLENRRQ